MQYTEIALKSFKNNLVYRAECIGEIVNLFAVFIVNISIWRAVYQNEGDLTGVPFRMVVTYVFLAQLIFNVFAMDDFFVEKKIKSGGIAFDMLRPFNFTLYLLFYNLGILLFRIVFLFCPMLLVGWLCFHLLEPFSTTYFLYFILSVSLGYFIMYCLNYIIWLCSFWIYRIFSLVTIKDTLLLILSGAVFPIWMFPDKIQEIIRFTPFEAILYIPITIYLGQTPVDEILTNLFKQVIWLVILFIFGQLLWKKAKKNFVVQGG